MNFLSTDNYENGAHGCHMNAESTDTDAATFALASMSMKEIAKLTDTSYC